MIVECPSCGKNYKVDDSLIANNGRLVQCSNCSNKWIVKKEIKIDEVERDDQNLRNNNQTNKENTISPDINGENNHVSETKKPVEKKIGFFSILIVFLISLFALFLFLETFKYQISLKWKNFDIYINNIYEIFDYMLILIKDLFKSY
tara:strand:- start:238 stop:678 length:441 start_codon:yes stop_codon:yes gene_type:complete